MSANKTENYKLHTWEASDDFLRQEFNENFAAIDAAIHENVVAGAYIGDGADRQAIDLGFTPKAVLVMDERGEASYSTYIRGGLAVSGGPCRYGDQEIIVIVEGGFRAVYDHSKYVDIGANIKGETYHYLAFR
ncbi:MAG: hypothetical protein HFF04_08075 [Oscillospiraceae bacterium]|nr:hypothetical protein [Oscillospiraceae bacterium]